MNDIQTALATGEQPVLNNTGIDMGMVIQEYKSSKQFTDQYTKDFPELANLADGISITHESGKMFIGDTTIAGLVRAIPTDSLQQLPVLSAEVNGTKVSIPAYIVTFLVRKYAFNEDTFGKGLLSTLQIGAEQAITNGYAAFMVATGTMYSEFGTRLRLLHWKDANFEPGIQDGDETGFTYTTAHLTRSRLKKIRKSAVENPNTSWNVAAIDRLLEGQPRTTNYSIYESDARKNQAGENAGPTYEIVTRNETSPYGDIITFSEEVQDVPLRVYKSKSKFGYPRVQLLVIDPAPLSPFGISRVRLASPNQNLLNVYLGHIASMLLLNSAPPLLKRGRFTKPVQLVQNAVWETLDPQASVELKQLDNGALAQFVPMAQQFVGQIQNIMGRPSGTLGGGTNLQGFSKTGPGVKMQQQAQDTSTTKITNILENFLRQYALVAVDTLLSEQEGQDYITVDDETKNNINNLAPGTIGDDNQFLMDWETFYANIRSWSMHVDVSLGKDEIDEKRRGDLQDMLVVLAQNAAELGPEAVQKVTDITNMLLQDKAPSVGTISSAAPAPGGLPMPGAAPQGSPAPQPTAPPTTPQNIA